MARIDWKVSITPIQTQTGNSEALDAETLAADVKATLGGGNSSGTWNGADVANWTNGVCAHVEAHSTASSALAASGDDMIFIKHTGIRYDSSTGDNLKADGTADTTAILVQLGANAFCQLKAGEGICLPAVQGDIKIKSTATSGTAPAAQVMTLT